MRFKNPKEYRIYSVITILVIVIILVSIFFSGTSINSAYVDDRCLNDRWYEDFSERSEEERFFGLEKQVSFTYKNNDVQYPASLTVTTFKTIFMMNEKELLEKTIETIYFEAGQIGISIDNSSKINGERTLNNSHKSNYVIFEGIDENNQSSEKMLIIGETWNCGRLSTSIICIGLSQVTDNTNNNTQYNLEYWADILRDKQGVFVEAYDSEVFKGYNGLIFNVKCH